MQVSGIDRLVLCENGDLILNGEKVGCDAALAGELLKIGRLAKKKPAKSPTSGALSQPV